MDFEKFTIYCNEVMDNQPEEELILVNSDENIRKLINLKLESKIKDTSNLIPSKNIIVIFIKH